MDVREQNKEREMPTPLGYNLPNRDSSSSKLSSPTVGERSDHQPAAQSRTLIFSGQSPQTSLNHHDHHLYPPNSSLPPNPLQPQLQQQHRPTTTRDPDPDPISFSSPIGTANITSTPVVRGSSNPQRTLKEPSSSSPQQHTTATTAPLIRYLECLKNHAASIGGHVMDGCCEFMPSGEEGTPECLTCAACDCHRNFHRKVEAQGEFPQHVSNNQHIYYPIKSNGHHNRTHSPRDHHATHHHVQFPTPSSSIRFSNSHGGATASAPRLIQPMMVAFGVSSGGPSESSSEDLNMLQSNDIHGQLLSVQPSTLSKKRFRTKFTQEQKDSMLEFAEKLGWKIQKQDEQELHQFCSQVGVKRQVFKVWMHNSKQAMKKKQDIS